MMNEKEAIRISKFLSLVLRHKPEQVGLQLDKNGWTDVDELLRKCNQHNVQLTLEDLQHVVATNSKKRFSFNEQGDKIRANQGHSVDVELGLEPATPPPILYHGTADRFATSILEKGLMKQQRQHVHLSRDTETALQVGKRHGRPVVLEVQAGQMFKNNYTFYLSANDVWLTEHVPAKYLNVASRK